MESVRRKIGSLINLGSNKVSVVRFATFYNFLKLCLLKSFSKNNLKKWKMLMTEISSILWGLRQRVIGSLLLRAFTLCLKSMNNFYIITLLMFLNYCNYYEIYINMRVYIILFRKIPLLKLIILLSIFKY